MFDPTKAKCNGTELDLFYPRQGDNGRNGKRFCQSCPVIQECLATALATDPMDDWGIWGGTTEAERRKMREHKNELVAA